MKVRVEQHDGAGQSVHRVVGLKYYFKISKTLSQPCVGGVGFFVNYIALLYLVSDPSESGVTFQEPLAEV